MNALSRREEETLLKTTKARALRECDPVVKEFAECASGRTISVAWACREHLKRVQDCMVQYTGPEPMEAVRAEYLRLRNQQQDEQLKASTEGRP
ncbi:putative required for mitochondrial cytochrome c oxidase (COX) assembly and respiration [Lyophyllum shimeji]|uniref:COX assembly mitochondrial protein n=1 Tax=Lyophyllum shimeji TaxID=47721 RepID=A0A9P3PIZ3_LYOSH|nr:putative required for mitochondrial cytochrome c oxidase (COX) assembly and respiration [Lyophyllum shimeji]